MISAVPRRCGLLAVLSLPLLLAACTGPSDPDAAQFQAPPTIVCGTTLWSGADGAVVASVWQPSAPAGVSAGGLLFVRVSRTCSQGSQVSITPASAAAITATARTSDGELAAIVLRPRRRGPLTVTAERDGHLVGRLALHP
jgi:hypothetical protein